MMDVRQTSELPDGASGAYYSLPMLEQTGAAHISRLPVSLRILLESVRRGSAFNVLEQLLADETSAEPRS